MSFRCFKGERELAVRVTYSDDVRKKLQTGIDKLADIVKVTLGPMGRNVLIQRKDGPPLVINDGATIVKDIELSDFTENMGARVIREVALKANEASGDGTTTAIVLAQQIVQQSFRNIAAGADPMMMKKGIQNATQLAVAAIKKQSVPVRSHLEIAQVASLSAQDKQLGELIAEAIGQVGGDGISIRESGTMRTELRIEKGMQFDRGFLIPQMADDSRKMVSELMNPFILVTDKRISGSRELIPLMEKLAPLGSPLLIVAEGIEGEALGLLMENRLRGVLNTVAVHPPAYGEGRVARMEDLALLTGGVFFSENTGYPNLSDATPDMLGRAVSVRIERHNTVVGGSAGKAEDIEQRIRYLKILHDRSKYEFDRQQLTERIAKLGRGVAFIDVGAPTLVEMKERKLRGEDALNAAKAAIGQGVVSGGGAAYLRCIPALKAYADTLSDDKKIGVQIIIGALKAPASQIAENAGLNGVDVVARTVKKPAGFGFDALKEEYVNMFEAGIVDPALVTCLALQSASSAAAALISSEAGVTATGK